MIIKIFIFSLILSYTNKSLSTSPINKVEIELSNIRSIIKSSKKGYENYYLFIGKVHKLVEKKQSKKGIPLLPKNSMVEILLNKGICYEEVKLSFLLNRPFSLKIQNVKKDIFKLTPKKKKYDGFLKVSVVDDNSRPFPSCFIEKL